MIKSFDDFIKESTGGNKSPKKKAGKSKRKEELNESLFAKNKDKQVMNVNGKRHKVVWRDKGNGNHVVKTVNDLDITDENGRLSPLGQSSLSQHLNQLTAFQPKWDANFFKDNFIVYTVKRDNDRTQKIAFTNTPRAGRENIGAEINFISSEEMGAADVAQTQQNILIEPIPDPVVVDDDTTTVVTDPATVISDNFAGKKFKYTWKEMDNVTNIGLGSSLEMSTCDIEITETGAFHYQSQSIVQVSGTIHYVNGAVFAVKDASEDKVEVIGQDKEFWIKCFTDEDFLRQQIGEDEGEESEEFTEFTLDNIKKYLYDEDRFPFFPEEKKSNSVNKSVPIV